MSRRLVQHVHNAITALLTPDARTLSFQAPKFRHKPQMLTKVLQELERKALVGHGFDFDLRLLAAGFSFMPQEPVFDTMLAAQLLNVQKKSLGALVERYCVSPLHGHKQRPSYQHLPYR